MTTVTIHLSEEQARKLKKAEQVQASPEVLPQASIDELLTYSDDEFKRALRDVLEKDSVLYHRLAAGA